MPQARVRRPWSQRPDESESGRGKEKMPRERDFSEGLKPPSPPQAAISSSGRHLLLRPPSPPQAAGAPRRALRARQISRAASRSAWASCPQLRQRKTALLARRAGSSCPAKHFSCREPLEADDVIAGGERPGSLVIGVSALAGEVAVPRATVSSRSPLGRAWLLSGQELLCAGEVVGRLSPRAGLAMG
jgi:hypothetical protein